MNRHQMAAALIAAWIPLAWAHSPMSGSTPADGARLSEPPAELTLRFARPARVVRVELVGADGKAQALEIPSRDKVKELALPVSVPGSGNYEVRWRALGADGHAMSGTFHFSVQAP
ncbi:MAG: copper resistance protein CopC [Burkholderiaceae bacterium]